MLSSDHKNIIGEEQRRERFLGFDNNDIKSKPNAKHIQYFESLHNSSLYNTFFLPKYNCCVEIHENNIFSFLNELFLNANK